MLWLSCFFSNYLFTSFGRQFWICPKSCQRRKWMSPYHEFAIAFSSVFKCKTILKREKCLWKNIFFTYLVLVFPTQEGWQSSISWCIDAQVSDADKYISIYNTQRSLLKIFVQGFFWIFFICLNEANMNADIVNIIKKYFKTVFLKEITQLVIKLLRPKICVQVHHQVTPVIWRL